MLLPPPAHETVALSLNKYFVPISSIAGARGSAVRRPAAGHRRRLPPRHRRQHGAGRRRRPLRHPGQQRPRAARPPGSRLALAGRLAPAQAAGGSLAPGRRRPVLQVLGRQLQPAARRLEPTAGGRHGVAREEGPAGGERDHRAAADLRAEGGRGGAAGAGQGAVAGGGSTQFYLDVLFFSTFLVTSGKCKLIWTILKLVFFFFPNLDFYSLEVVATHVFPVKQPVSVPSKLFCIP